MDLRVAHMRKQLSHIIIRSFESFSSVITRAEASERFFGLSGPEGNHGEDVKECYYFINMTPSHSYAKMLYKYPIAEFPYEELVRVNRERGKRKTKSKHV
jgi:hypothetical protein